MTVAIRSSGPQQTTAPTTTWTRTITSGESGDVAYVPVTSRGHTAGTAYPTVTDNSGDGQSWTLIGESADRKATLWFKRFNQTMAGSVITVAGCVDSCSGGYAAFSGAETSGDPHTNLSVETNAAGNESHAGFTPAFADSMLVLVIFNSTDDSASTPTAPAGLTEMWDQISTGGNDCACAMSSVLQVGGPSATGNFTWTQANDAGYSMVFAIKPPQAGGTLFTVDVSGAISSSATLVRQAGKSLAGTTAPASSLLKHMARSLSATVSPAGAVAKQVQRLLTAAAGSVGALLKQVQPRYSGVIGPAAALTTSKVILLALTAVIAPGGALVKHLLRALGGSVAPGGVLVKQLQRVFAGALAPIGALVKQAQKRFAALLNPSAALTTSKVILLALAAAIAPAGALTRRTQKLFAGAAASSATLRRSIGKALTATLAPGGTLLKTVRRTLAGALGLVGTALVGTEKVLIIATRIVLGAVGQHVNRQPENRRISISDAPRSVALKSQQTDIPDE